MPSPRSTLFPYTTLFRSCRPPHAHRAEGTRHRRRTGRLMHRQWSVADRYSTWRRSEERVSRNAEPEIYTLSLHDALPILSSTTRSSSRRDETSQAHRSANAKAVERCRPIQHVEEIGRAGQQECRARDLHSFPTRRSSDLVVHHTLIEQKGRDIAGAPVG